MQCSTIYVGLAQACPSNIVLFEVALVPANITSNTIIEAKCKRLCIKIHDYQSLQATVSVAIITVPYSSLVTQPPIRTWKGVIVYNELSQRNAYVAVFTLSLLLVPKSFDLSLAIVRFVVCCSQIWSKSRAFQRSLVETQKLVNVCSPDWTPRSTFTKSRSHRYELDCRSLALSDCDLKLKLNYTQIAF